VPLVRYGRLPLLPLSGKAVDGEWVTIVQHPGGEPKQIAIRASQIVALPPDKAAGVDPVNFIHYSTDTEPGSSGSPVFNDQWQVLALHHKAVPSPETVDAPTQEKVWIANEGVRVSAIFRHLETNRFARPMAGRVLNRLDQALGFTPLPLASMASTEVLEGDRAPLPLTRWTNIAGYDGDFLSRRIALAPIYAPLLAAGKVAPLLDGSGHELAYRHFSSVIHKERKFPLITAVNIDGRLLRNPGTRGGWRQDARIAGEYQPDGEFYEKAKGDDPVTFSRGHQVRYLDPCWGGTDEEAVRAGEDTMHYTNAAPQVQHYNDIDWGDLEDYILDKGQTTEKRLTVFTGPIYRDDDPFYGRGRTGGPWRIPLSFWKIAVLQKFDDEIAAAAFVVGQTKYVQALYEAKVFSGLNPYSIEEIRHLRIQSTIASVEAMTGLDFSAIRPFDAQGSLEVTQRARWLTSVADIII
jgi:endonuclease G